MDSRKTIRLILSAYACRPDAGSEPATGWGWALHLALAGCQVTLLTAGRNRKAIEDYLEKSPCSNLRPHFIDVPVMNPMSSGALHYAAWQYLALRHARVLHAAEPFDLAHHVSYGSVVFPTLLAELGLPTIFGPVGGGQTTPDALLPYFGKHRRKEALRKRFMRFLPTVQPYRVRVQKMSLVFAANTETMSMLRDAGCKRIELLCDTGALAKNCAAGPRTFVKEPKVRLLWVGRFLPRKGLALALDAVALANPDVHLTIMGGGITEAQMHAKIAERNLTGRVSWKGTRSSWSEVHEAYLEHDALLFTSLRDSFGSQNLEAMCAGLPIIALNLSGVRDFVDPGAAIKVDVGLTPQETAQSLARAINDFSTLPTEARDEISAVAWRSAKSFLWEARAKQVYESYQQLLMQREMETKDGQQRVTHKMQSIPWEGA